MQRKEGIMPIPEGLRKKYQPPTPAEVLPPEDWLQKEVDEAISFILKGSPNVFHASSLGDDPRILFLKFIGVFEEKIEARIARAFGTGNAIHERWAKDLEKTKRHLRKEETVPFHGHLPIRGRLDFIIRAPTGEPCLIELKSINSYGFKNLTEPDRKHVVQWTYYAAQMQIKDGYLVYEQKDTHELKCFQMVLANGTVYAFLKGREIARWESLLEKIYEELEYTMWCTRNNAVPQMCTSCKLSGKCKHPKICKEQEGKHKLVTLDDWRKMYGNVRQGSGTDRGDSNTSPPQG